MLDVDELTPCFQRGPHGGIVVCFSLVVSVEAILRDK